MSVICVKYRILPTRAQETALSQALETLRGVYNSLLNERKYIYETTGSGIGQYTQEKHFSMWRKEFPELAQVHSHLLQNVALRINNAFTAFFRRVRNNETPGYPRFKGKGTYDSFTFKQYGNGVKLEGETLSVSKIGQVKCIVHRPLIGTPKTCTIRRQAGKWFACFACEVGIEPYPASSEEIGIDVGLEKFAALSDGTFVENPRFFRKDEKALAKAQRKLAKQARGSAKRRKAKKVVSRIHERVRNRRHDFVHQFARRLVNRYGLIAVEKLSVKNMSKSPAPKQDESTGEYLPNGASAKAGLNKSILDASWSQFRTVLMQKAERAVRQVIEVNPAYTSQDCSRCGHRAKKQLKERWHHCPMCGLFLDRDTNAAFNILASARRAGALARLTVWGNTPSASMEAEEAVPL